MTRAPRHQRIGATSSNTTGEQPSVLTENTPVGQIHCSPYFSLSLRHLPDIEIYVRSRSPIDDTSSVVPASVTALTGGSRATHEFPPLVLIGAFGLCCLEVLQPEAKPVNIPV
jgi:hypothetical protein